MCLEKQGAGGIQLRCEWASGGSLGPLLCLAPRGLQVAAMAPAALLFTGGKGLNQVPKVLLAWGSSGHRQGPQRARSAWNEAIVLGPSVVESLWPQSPGRVPQPCTHCGRT